MNSHPEVGVLAPFALENLIEFQRAPYIWQSLPQFSDGPRRLLEEFHDFFFVKANSDPEVDSVCSFNELLWRFWWWVFGGIDFFFALRPFGR